MPKPLLFPLCALVLAGFAHGQVPGASSLTKQAAITRLLRAEKFVESIYCEYEHRVVTASAEQADRIRKTHGQDADSFIINSDDSAERFAVVRFWSKGVKRRREAKFPESKSSSQGALVSAFDAQVIRTLNELAGGQPRASLMTVTTGHWYGKPEDEGPCLMTHYYKTALSEET
jgi:hypothetical protein